MTNQSRPTILFAALLLLAVSLACSLGGRAESPTATPAPTDLPPAATDTPAAAENGQTAASGSTGDDLTTAFGRATTMLAQNAKPTPPPSDGLGGKEENGTAPPATVAAPTVASQGSAPSIQVDNRASTAACYVYISLPTDTTWGVDQLGEAETIEPDAGLVFEVAANTYDLRIDDCHGKVMVVEFALPVSGATQILLQDQAPPAAGNASLTVINDLDTSACYVFVSPTISDSWGDDWLGTGYVVPAGGTAALGVAPGEYDLRAADCNFDALSEVYQVSIPADGHVWALSGESGSATVTLVNNGPVSVCYFQISLSISDTWGPDWLGESEVIGTGNSRVFDLLPDIYDMRSLDCDQETIKEEYGISVQGNTTWTVP